MPEDTKESNVLEFTDSNPQELTPESPTSTTEAMKPLEEIEEAVGATDEPKPTKFMGIEFPAYFQGMHFVDIKGSIVMAVDPAHISMEMKANWELKYRPELAALGKQVIEKNLNIKIETL